MMGKCDTCNMPNTVKEQNGSIKDGLGFCSICYKIREGMEDDK